MNAELIARVNQNDEESVIELLSRGADPDWRDSNGRTPLLIAANKNNADLISILLTFGADTEAAERGGSGDTPLMRAVIGGNVDSVRILLRGGALVNKTDLNGHTALYFATTYNLGAMVNILLAHGASPDISNKQRMTPLHAALHLCDKALDPAANAPGTDKPGDHSRTALDDGCNGGPGAIFSALLRHSSRPDMRDNMGNTPLHLAARSGYYEMVCQLLAVPVKPDIANHSGDTPLHLAAAKGDATIINTLLKHGFKPDCKDHNKATPLHYAVRGKDIEPVRELLAATFELDGVNDLGDTALHVAVKEEKDEIARALLLNGADPNIRSKTGNTPLHYATELKNGKCIDMLLANGARTDIKNYRGLTPFAMAQGDTAIINQLTNHPPYCPQPQSLLQNCRTAIRSRLIDNHPRQPLSGSIDRLDCLPGSMRTYLYYPPTL